MEGKRRQEGERLIVTKKSRNKGWGQFPKGRWKYEIENKSFSKQDRNSEAGEIDKGKGDSMTQEEELKKGEVGYKKSSVQKKESRRGKLM